MSNEPIPKPVFTTHTWVVATYRGSLPDEVGLPLREDGQMPRRPH